ncbi:MAG: iron-sulfur cluster assembly scaffold protein [Elusimicrobiota bacterium]
MMTKADLPLEMETILKKWAEERLECIGVYKERTSGYEELAEKIIDDLRSVYSDKAIELFLKPEKNSVIRSPAAFARITGPCGDTMEIYLEAEKGKIKKAAFTTDGCDPSIASGGMAAELAEGRKIEEAGRITQEDILRGLGRFPEDSLHCALLAANTLKKAVEKLLQKTADKHSDTELQGGSHV